MKKSLLLVVSPSKTLTLQLMCLLTILNTNSQTTDIERCAMINL